MKWFVEFVEAARRVFKFELKERSISITPQLLSSAEIQEITDPPAFLSQVRGVVALFLFRDL